MLFADEEGDEKKQENHGLFIPHTSDLPSSCYDDEFDDIMGESLLGRKDDWKGNFCTVSS